VERLAGPDAMGNLFKVMAITPADADFPGFPGRID
jgi:SAM-dependent MidA family methyltransferase